MSLLLPLAVLAVPIVDTSFVVAKRLKHGLPVYESDRSHLHHRFLNIGYSQRARRADDLRVVRDARRRRARDAVHPAAPARRLAPVGRWLSTRSIGGAALAASIYIVYLLEIVKLANPILRRREQLARERKTA